MSSSPTERRRARVVDLFANCDILYTTTLQRARVRERRLREESKRYKMKRRRRRRRGERAPPDARARRRALDDARAQKHSRASVRAIALALLGVVSSLGFDVKNLWVKIRREHEALERGADDEGDRGELDVESPVESLRDWTPRRARDHVARTSEAATPRPRRLARRASSRRRLGRRPREMNDM